MGPVRNLGFQNNLVADARPLLLLTQKEMPRSASTWLHLPSSPHPKCQTDCPLPPTQTRASEGFSAVPTGLIPGFRAQKPALLLATRAPTLLGTGVASGIPSAESHFPTSATNRICAGSALGHLCGTQYLEPEVLKNIFVE